MNDQTPSLVHTQVTSDRNGDHVPVNPDLSKAPDNFSSPTKPAFKSYRDISIERCSAEYQQVEYLYELAADDTKHGRVNLLRDCRQGAHFAVNSETRAVRIISNHCSLRWCPMCSSTKGHFVTEAVTELIHRMKHPKMITFTLKHTSAPLAEQIEHLYTSFRRLRKMKSIKKKITGGVWFFQIKLIKSTGEWHPHLHMLVDGEYIAQRYLSELWRKASYGSYIVFIKPVKNPEKVAEYVARYAVKPAYLAYYSLEHGVEIIQALHSRRICGTWGIGRGTCLSIPHGETEGDWYRVGNYRTIIELGSNDQSAKLILSAWKNNEPLPPGIDMQHIENCNYVANPHPPPAPYQHTFFD